MLRQSLPSAFVDCIGISFVNDFRAQLVVHIMSPLREALAAYTAQLIAGHVLDQYAIPAAVVADNSAAAEGTYSRS